MQIKEYIPKQFVEWSRRLSFENIAGFDYIRSIARAEATTRLIVIGAATIVVPIAGKNLLTGDAARYRPYLGMAASFTLAAAAAGTSDAIRYRRYADRGWEVAAETDIEAAEDLVQTATERKYELHAAPKSEKVLIEQLEAPPPPIVFPEVDLARLVAEKMIDPHNGSSFMIACPRRTGKSNLLRAIIQYGHQLTNGVIDYWVFAGKAGETYCGLEKQLGKYIYSGDASKVPEVFSRYQKINSYLSRISGEGVPVIAVDDEYNNTLVAGEVYKEMVAADPDNDDKTKYDKLVPIFTYEVITKGPSKRVNKLITSHSSNVEDIKVNSKIRESLTQIVLGRGNKMEALQSALDSRYVVDDPQRRKELSDQLQQYKEQCRQGVSTRDRVIALTNLVNDDWQLVTLPIYPDHQPELTAQPHSIEFPTPKPQDTHIAQSFDDLANSLKVDDSEDAIECPELPLPKWWVNLEEIKPQERQAVRYLWKMQGMRDRKDIAKAVWDVSKGGSPAWKSADWKIGEILEIK